jgi:hypothetical protein
LSGGGRALQQLIGSHYGFNFGGKSWGDLTGPSGRFGHVGTHLNWVGDPNTDGSGGTSGRGGGSEGTSGTGRPQRMESEAEKKFWNHVAVDAVGFAVGGPTVRGLLGIAAAEGLQYFLNRGSGDPDPDWVISPAAGAEAGLSSSDQYPAFGTQPGRFSPQEMAAALHRLQRQQNWGRRAPWWGNQWVHSPRASGSSSTEGHGTSAAPERVVLRGMKHPNDWVAFSQSVG